MSLAVVPWVAPFWIYLFDESTAWRIKNGQRDTRALQVRFRFIYVNFTKNFVQSKKQNEVYTR